MPPFEVGAVKGTLTEVAEAIVGVPIVGAPGTALGVIDADALDAEEVPFVFVAVTVNV